MWCPPRGFSVDVAGRACLQSCGWHWHRYRRFRAIHSDGADTPWPGSVHRNRRERERESSPAPSQMVSHKVLVAIILLNVYIGVQSVFYLFGGVILSVLFIMAFLNGPRLLDWASSPPHLQFNKYVLTGYRPISSVQDCIRSLFYLHNELGNIYTHGEYQDPDGRSEGVCVRACARACARASVLACDHCNL